MNEVDVRKKVDILITILIAYFFMVCMGFKIFDFVNSFENYFMLTVVMIIGVVSYYTNVTLALVLTLICDFCYMSFNLYIKIVNNVDINFNTYYWLILIPITALIISLLSKNIMQLQIKVGILEEENSKLIMIDQSTGIRNNRALMMELPIYMKISKRHKLPVTLIMVKFKFSDKLKSILGREKYRELLIQACYVFDKSLREEDVKYIVNDRTLAFITITNEEGSKIVKNRFRENINNFEFIKDSIYKNINLDIQIGTYTFDESIDDVMTFLKLAEKEVEYDIQE
ncbi:GGDEF domain-containing protein [Clostridium uliginosum]|uniref:GGDEF domain-containing protein, diguanylate cyclase (C-di-GMP synthetase) or its enzymatically inactive variants n=1 Tax=Clostridium uliginosum TaxID=119641 RepID=A0A1I1H7A8_9CLOT|nr:diguanylate cyclase [Clostridium uliginosum]SFC19844.1 GGDEF domain-containing protein, diguanylate cyclase (c-di-GMP synthetase) or its enzymatically inactive variants [Clostridium uliginosum]